MSIICGQPFTSTTLSCVTTGFVVNQTWDCDLCRMMIAITRRVWKKWCAASVYLVWSNTVFLLQAKLCKKFRVQGIPKLVLVDGETGQTITRDGYSHLMEDESGAEFPWRRKKFSDIIKGKLLKDGKEVDALEELKGKTVGLYFSAHWVSENQKFSTASLML